jgi:outer membrane protein OmpA-like peptidoglycan-associated protein
MNPVIFRWIKRGLGILIPVLFLVMGCANSQQEMMAKDQLERARSAYTQAKSNRNVEAFAPIPFSDASKAMQAAEKAKGAEEKEQLGYIAEKKSLLAVSAAEGKMAESEIEKLNRDTANIIAEKRTQEARVAQKEAEQARLLAMAEGERAAKAKAEAEQARMAAQAESEKAARAKAEAEQARSAARAESERAAKAKAESDQLMRELSDLKAKQTERGIILTIGDVLFATGKADLSPEAMRSVDKLGEFLQKYTNRNVLIEGHTDSVGSDELNLTLSQKRADSLKEALTGKGIPAERITTVGYGKKFPVASNETTAGKQQNRRVEVSILNEGVKPEKYFRQ